MGRRSRLGDYQRTAGGVLSRAEIPDATDAQLATPPAFAATVTVPAVTLVTTRRVFGYFSLAATGANPAVISCLAETGVATGVYKTLVVAELPTGTSGTFKVPYQFEVSAGRRYQFTKGGAGGVTEAITAYSTMEW